MDTMTGARLRAPHRHDYNVQTVGVCVDDPLPPLPDGSLWEVYGFDIIGPRTYSSSLHTGVAWITVAGPTGASGKEQSS